MTAAKEYRDAVERYAKLEIDRQNEIAALATLRDAYNLAHARPAEFDGDFVAGLRADMSAAEDRIARMKTELSEVDAELTRLQQKSKREHGDDLLVPKLQRWFAAAENALQGMQQGG